MRARIGYDADVKVVEDGSESTLLIAGSQAMQGWERDLMRESAELLTTFGSTFLEVGLGFGFSALAIASTPKTASHVVIEKHREVIERFRSDHPEPPAALRVEHADFFEVVDGLEPGRLDGIMFDPALPMAAWRDAALWEDVMPKVTRALRPGGAFVPFFTTEPKLREQYWPHFASVLVRPRPYVAYAGTTYTRGGTSGTAFVQCYVKGGAR